MYLYITKRQTLFANRNQLAQLKKLGRIGVGQMIISIFNIGSIPINHL